MGKPSKYPPGPVTLQCTTGREQFRRVFKPFARQWSQPMLLKLTHQGLGDRVVHSSQITGFATGTLLDPAPKVLLSLGKFNLMLAEGKLPKTLEQHWKDAQPMRLPSGEVMGPAEMFLAFTGELDLQLAEEREIPMDQEARVSQEFGKWVRMELAKRGVDFVVSDQQRLMQASPAFRELTTGKDLRGELLIEALPAVGEELEMSVEELWDVLGGLIT